MQEIWRPAAGWEGLYELSTYGRLRRVGRDALGRHRYIGHILKIHKSKGSPYLKYLLSRPGEKPKNITVHSLVAATFIGPRPEGMQCNHKNRNKTDNRPENLEYVTPSENYRHALRNGHQPVRGSEHWNAKLTEAKVREIRKLAAQGMMLKDIAPQFGVNRSIISRIVAGLWWRHVV